MPAARAVTVIPPTINLHTHAPAVAAQKRRAAGYARVSTDSDEQFTSYEAQIDYYTRYIKSNQEWEFVSVYTDEGISGTNTKHRVGFNQMIADALSGKIGRLLTERERNLCQNCHSYASHSSPGSLTGDPDSSGGAFTRRASCLTCHGDVHGSNTSSNFR